MGSTEIINDLHYDGKNVSERLAFDGLLDQFTTAVEAKDRFHVVELLQRVAITKGRAEQLAAMLLEAPIRTPIHLNIHDPRNQGVMRKQNELGFPPVMLPAECPRDPYWNLGSHPDAVEQVWDNLGSVLPVNCRCVVLGTPGLVAPRSGILLASAFGTAYILRIPREAMEEALRRGASTQMKWYQAYRTDLAQEYGNDWIFGRYLKQEPGWLLAVYQAVEATGR